MYGINLKRYYFNKATYWLIPIAIVIWIVVFSTLDISREDRFSLSTCLMGLEYVIIFYLSRLDPQFINLDTEIIEIIYFDQSRFFTKADEVYIKKDISVLDKGNKLILSIQGNIIARIRKNAIELEDWEALKEYFASNIIPSYK